MNNKIQKKLSSVCGETIAEVLIALLISTLALLMLAVMISSTVSMVNKSKVKMESYYEENAALETLSEKDENLKSVSITAAGAAGATRTIETPNVYLYSNSEFGADKTVYAYRLKP